MNDEQKYLDAIRKKTREIDVDILDYEVARDADDMPPLGALLDLLTDRTQYILNYIRLARVIAETPSCAKGEVPHKFEVEDSTGQGEDSDAYLKCTVCGEVKRHEVDPETKQD